MESARYNDCPKPSKLPARHADCAHFRESVQLLAGFTSLRNYALLRLGSKRLTRLHF